jgi:hypothetical protein
VKGVLLHASPERKKRGLTIRSRFPRARKTPDATPEPLAVEAESQVVGAVYRGGALLPDAPLDLPEESRVRLTVTPEAVSADAGDTALLGSTVATHAPPRSGLRTRLLTGEWLLFGLSVLVYAFTRLFALARFPIYFFADEATNAVFAEDLISRGFHDAQGNFLPLYFEAAGNRWTPLLSVYVHAISVSLFGKSVLVTRGTSAVVSILGAVAVGLILKWIFKARFWWIGALLMAMAPAWFLHTRTGFETVMMTAFFACFLLCYLLYRTRSPRYLYAALLFGAATFYTYSNGQMIMAAAGTMLALSDIRYHLRHWRTVLIGLLVLAVLMIPLLSFRLNDPGALPQHLRAIDSYWFRSMPLQDKVVRFVDTYTYGLSPAYWFFPNDYDLMRHRMKGYGNLDTLLLPFFLLGVGLCLRRIKSSPCRAVLIAALAAPAGAALVDVSITRVLAFIVPACILAGLGLDWVLEWLVNRLARPRAAGRGISVSNSTSVIGVAIFGVLSLASVGMLRDALVNGPLWYTDYGLYGMQYGAEQLFTEAIPAYLTRDPNAMIMMSSTWANGTDTFIRFFLPPEQRGRVQMLNIDHFLDNKSDLTSNMVLVMTPSEYERARTSPKFKQVNVEQIIPYPDGKPGFYFARLAYVDNVDAIFAAERLARQQLVAEPVQIGGQAVTVRHSQFEAGSARDLFDGDPFTLVRGREANPLIIELAFSKARAIQGLSATFGTMDFELTAQLFAPGATAPITYTQTYRNLPPDPTVNLPFAQAPATVERLRLEIKQLGAGDMAKIHVRELALR